MHWWAELSDLWLLILWVDRYNMMEKTESLQKLYTRMRLWESPDQYVIEPTDGSLTSSLAISRVDGSMNLIGWLIYLPFGWQACIIAWLIYLALLFRFSILQIFLCPPDEPPQCSSVRRPKVRVIFGVVGMLKLLAGKIPPTTYQICCSNSYKRKSHLLL